MPSRRARSPTTCWTFEPGSNGTERSFAAILTTYGLSDPALRRLAAESVVSDALSTYCQRQARLDDGAADRHPGA